MHHLALQTLLVFLVAGIAGIALAKVCRISPILGFFAAGAVVGPHGFDLLEQTEEFEVFAELGVAFLLFDVGTHLSFQKLWAMRKELLALGAAQVALSTAALAGIAMLLGLSLSTALVLGAGLSLSSTALVLQGLKDRGEGGSPLEQKALSLLVFQDLFVVFLLVVLPAFGGDAKQSVEAELGMALVKVLGAVALLTAIGRFLLQPVFRWITSTKNDELFTFAALAFVIAVAFGAGALGLSLPLGAFLAGLALSESRYSYLVRTEVHPFRGLLLSLFFLSVGMALPLSVFVSEPLLIAGLTLLLLATKAVVLFVVARLLSLGRGFATRLGLTLAQASEFSFVLFGVAAGLNLLEQRALSIAIATVSTSLALTPLLIAAAAKLAELVALPAAEPDAATGQNNRGKVVIVGYDDAAKQLARVLEAAEVDYVVFTDDREAVAGARCQGFAVEYGSPDRPRALGMATVGDAACIVSLVPSPKATRTLVAAVQQIAPQIPIYAVTSDLALMEELSRQDLRDIRLRSESTGSEVGRMILTCVGRTEPEVDEILERVAAMERGEDPVLEVPV